jgi:hypothetical protein
MFKAAKNILIYTMNQEKAEEEILGGLYSLKLRRVPVSKAQVVQNANT